MKSNAVKLKEGRCTGIGRDYVPWYTSREARSIGTSVAVPDPIEHRLVHLLSQTEADLYYLLRWDDRTAHIREQYLLDIDRINHVRVKLGLQRVPSTTCYTTDFLIDEVSGSMHAYSVKQSVKDFDKNSRKYRGKAEKYARFIERQRIEKEYWESQMIDFTIVTTEYINKTLVRNISMLMSYYDDKFIVSTEQKLLYLMAHKYFEVCMTEEYINPRALLSVATFDVDAVFEEMKEQYGEVDYGCR